MIVTGEMDSTVQEALMDMIILDIYKPIQSGFFRRNFDRYCKHEIHKKLNKEIENCPSLKNIKDQHCSGWTKFGKPFTPRSVEVLLM